MSIYYGYYSEQQATLCGYSIYKNASGTPIKVTEVCERPEPGSCWPDLQFVGIVCDFVSSHQRESDFKFIKLDLNKEYYLRPIPIEPTFKVFKNRNVPAKNA